MGGNKWKSIRAEGGRTEGESGFPFVFSAEQRLIITAEKI